jgi:hypothetical protein
VRHALAWLLIVWEIVTCVLCPLILVPAVYTRITRMALRGRAGDREAALAALRNRRHAARESPIERYLPRPP